MTTTMSVKARVSPVWNEKLRLEYMRCHQPWSQLPVEYFPCSGLSLNPPNFVYGFPVHALCTDDSPPMFAKLRAMQKNIPHPEFSNPVKYAPVPAICAFIADSMEGTFNAAYFGSSGVDGELDIAFVIRFYSSYVAPNPKVPAWVAAVVEIAREIMADLGWEDIPEPMWYLDAASTPCEDREDYNLPVY